MKSVFTFILSLTFFASHSQVAQDVETLKKEVLLLRNDVNSIRANLVTSERRFKRGMLVSTIGYSVTIAGGLLLGRKQDDLGKGLLIAGGVTGVTGTVLLVDAFRYLGGAGNRKP